MKAQKIKEMCVESAEIARAEVLEKARKEGLKVEKIIKTLVEAMDANENKVFFDKDRGRCFVGPEQIAWMPRLKAIDTAIGLLGIKAPEKQEVSFPNGAPITFNEISTHEREILLQSNKAIRDILNGEKGKARK